MTPERSRKKRGRETVRRRPLIGAHIGICPKRAVCPAPSPIERQSRTPDTPDSKNTHQSPLVFASSRAMCNMVPAHPARHGCHPARLIAAVASVGGTASGARCGWATWTGKCLRSTALADWDPRVETGVAMGSAGAHKNSTGKMGVWRSLNPKKAELWRRGGRLWGNMHLDRCATWSPDSRPSFHDTIDAPADRFGKRVSCRVGLEIQASNPLVLGFQQPGCHAMRQAGGVVLSTLLCAYTTSLGRV
jgi:hypothetical protein